jgi:hypothetical protein
MVLPFVAMKAGKYVGKKVASKVGAKVVDKYGDQINGRLGAGVAEKVGGRLGIKMPGAARGDGEAETTPYLGKWDSISQVWINRWTILLLLALARVLISTSSVDDDIDDAKEKVLSACVKLEEVGSVMASMPHYMSKGINEMTATGIEGTINGVVTAVTMIISGIEALIIFVFGLWKSTWLCLISALVQGAFDVAAKVVEGAADIAKSATSGVADLLSGAQSAVDGFVKTINSIPLVPDMPDLNLGEAIDTLKNLNINVDDALGSISDVKDKVPTYEELDAQVGDLISIPFNMAKDKISKNWGDYTFDRNVLPVAAKDNVAICSNDDRIPGFFADLAKLVNTMRGIFIGVVVVASILVILYFCWMEMRRWNKAMETVDMANEKAHDLFDAAWIANHPYLARFAFWAAEKMTSDPDKQILIRWTIAYATSPPALFVLSLATSGLITCIMQLVLLNVIRAEIPKLAASIGGMAAGVVSALDSTSATWANDTNSALTSFQSTVNEDMFGNIKEVTNAVNDALQKFEDIINDGLNTAFGDTPFMDPLKTVVDCILLDKVEKVQTGLTWVNDNAALSFPTLANDTFSIKNLASNGSDTQAFLNDPEAATNAEISGSVSKVTDKLKSSIIQEMLIALVLLLVYFVVVMMGVGRAVWGSAKGINGSRPGGLAGDGGGMGTMGAIGTGAAIGAGAGIAANTFGGGGDEDRGDEPPVDVDENGNHWVEHDGVQYMIGADGEYVIGSDGQYISRAANARGGDYDSDGSSGSSRFDNGGGYPDEKAGGGGFGDDYERDENGNGGGGYPDEKGGYRSNPFDDQYAAQRGNNDDVPPYPAPSYQSPYAEDDRGRF